MEASICLSNYLYSLVSCTCKFMEREAARPMDYGKAIAILRAWSM